METLVAPPPELHEPFIPPVPSPTESFGAPSPSEIAEVGDPSLGEPPTEAQPSRLSRTWQRAKRWVIGEGIGNAVEAASIVAGVPLPLRVGADAMIDNWTYGSSEQGERGGRRAQLSTAAGMLAVNLASSYALQKGVPLAFEAVDESLNTTLTQTATQLVGKIGVMATAAPFISRRFNR